MYCLTLLWLMWKRWHKVKVVIILLVILVVVAHFCAYVVLVYGDIQELQLKELVTN